MAEKSTDICEDDCNYHVIKQLSKKLKLLWHINNYIDNAKKCGHDECVKVFEKIRKDEQKHAAMLKKLLVIKVEEGKIK